MNEEHKNKDGPTYQGVLSAIRAKGEAGVETIFVGIHARLVSHSVTFMLMMEMVDVQVEDHNWFPGTCFDCVVFMLMMEIVEGLHKSGT